MLVWERLAVFLGTGVEGTEIRHWCIRSVQASCAYIHQDMFVQLETETGGGFPRSFQKLLGDYSLEFEFSPVREAAETR